MEAAPSIETSDRGEDADQRVMLHGVGWAEYEALLAMRGDSAVPRITYLEGEVELMAPGRPHERDKTLLARLIEAYAEERGLRLDGFGSWTLKREELERGAEPDECYVLDGRDTEVPDFAIEVVKTSGGLPKLAVYKKLGVREVWFWERGTLRFHSLRDGEFVVILRSELLPGLDPGLVASAMTDLDQTNAVRVFRAALRRP